ncbi:MAG: DUF3147 family protein [Candidatus Marinimicrobia bacterium]|nr:DUF3147 family protein [Candidatus Neomarinimicrobiota bacterium]
MSFLIVKYSITAFIIVIISEIAKRHSKLGALISSLPLITIMVMVWLYIENQNIEKISKHAYYTFWYVVPTMPMFIFLPWILSKGINFWISLLGSIILTLCCFIITAIITKKFGIDLIP